MIVPGYYMAPSPCRMQDFNIIRETFYLILFSGVIRFTGRNMTIDNLVLHSGRSDLTINGNVKSIFYFFNHLNEKYSLDWSITSNRLNLDDFSSYLQQQTKTPAIETKKSTSAATVSDYISKIQSADFNVSLKVNKLTYKKIIVDSLQASLALKDDAVQFSKVSMQHIGLSVDEGTKHKFFGFRIDALDCNITKK